MKNFNEIFCMCQSQNIYKDVFAEDKNKSVTPLSIPRNRNAYPQHVTVKSQAATRG